MKRNERAIEQFHKVTNLARLFSLRALSDADAVTQEEVGADDATDQSATIPFIHKNMVIIVRPQKMHKLQYSSHVLVKTAINVGYADSQINALSNE